MDWFLKILDITEDEFYEILEKHQGHPWKFDKNAVRPGPALPDMPLWDRTEPGVPVGPPKGSDGKSGKYV